MTHQRRAFMEINKMLPEAMITRIGGIAMYDPSRAEFGDTASADDFRELAKRPQLTTLQCSRPVREDVWRLANAHFCAARPDVQVRVYAHYSETCDLSFARLLTNVRRFAADCLMKASNLDAIAEIPELESLSVGIFELQDFGVLERMPPGLKSLSLGITRSKKPSVQLLSRFRSLRTLYVEGHSKDIDVVSELKELEDLTLRSISIPDLRWLATLPNLRSLDIKLGGLGRFDGIYGKDSIEYLELWQVRGVQEIDIVGNLPGLQDLFLQSLPHVESFPDLRHAKALRKIKVQNMKSLHDFSALETASALEEFALLQGEKQTPEQLLPVLKNPQVRRARAYFGSDRRNSEFVRLREQYGKSD